MKRITIPYRRATGTLGLELNTVPESYYPVVSGLRIEQKDSIFYNLPLTSVGTPSSATEISREEIVNRVLYHMSPGAHLISVTEPSGAVHSFRSDKEPFQERLDGLARLLGKGSGILVQNGNDFKEFHFTLNTETCTKRQKRGRNEPPRQGIHQVRLFCLSLFLSLSLSRLFLFLKILLLCATQIDKLTN
jgi:hypothetical protein